MLIAETRNATSIRKEFSQFIDDVLREKPQAVKRNRDHFWSMSDRLVDSILSQITFQLICEEDEDGLYSGYFSEIDDLIFFGHTKEEMIKDAAEQLIQYTELYFENFQAYYNSPNRQKHFPYVFKVSKQDSIDKVIELLNA